MIYASPDNYMAMDVTATAPLVASAPPESIDQSFLNSLPSPGTPGIPAWTPAVVDTTKANETANSPAGVSSASPYMRPQSVFQFDPSLSQVNQDVLLQSRLLHQIDFYFSEDNLVRDTFLRRQMDESGWVPISVIAKFNRVAQLSTDLERIIQVSFDDVYPLILIEYLFHLLFFYLGAST